MPFLNDRLAEQGRARGIRAGEDELSCAASHALGRSGATPGLEGSPTEEHFAQAATGRLDADRIRRQLRTEIFGQDAAVEAVFRTLCVVQAGLTGAHDLLGHGEAESALRLSEKLLALDPLSPALLALSVQAEAAAHGPDHARQRLHRVRQLTLQELGEVPAELTED